YSLTSWSPGHAAGRPLPASVAAAIGVSAGPVHLGALAHGGSPGPSSTPPPPSPPPPHVSVGFRLAASDGGMFDFGDAHFYGSLGGRAIGGPIVGMAPTRSGQGYWMTGANGAVYGFGDAHSYGSVSGDPVATIGIAPTPAGDGYWV